MIKGHKNIQRVKPSGLELTDRVVGIQRVTKVTKGGQSQQQHQHNKTQTTKQMCV